MYRIDNLKTPFTFAIVADEGWEVASVSLNDEDITVDIDEDGNYTTADNLDDKRVSVVMRKKIPTALTEHLKGDITPVIHPSYIEIKGCDSVPRIKIHDVTGRCIFDGRDNIIPFDYKGVFILSTDDGQLYKFAK